MIELVRRLATLAVILTTGATLAALGARLTWFLELFSHFAVQYLVVQVLAAMLCLATGRRAVAVLALVMGVPNLLAVGPYLPGLVAAPAARAAAERPPGRLIAANLLYRQEDPSAMRGFLAGRSADVVVLSEFTPGWLEKLADFGEMYPYTVLRPRRNAWGIAVLSKYPLGPVEDLNLGDDQSSHVRVIVRLPSGPVELYAVHLASPAGPRQAAQRNTQLRELAKIIAAADPGMPRIVAGDFNLTPWSPHFGDLLRDARLTDPRRPFGLHYTWPAWPVPLLWIPIDHCLVSGPLAVTRVAAGSPDGSDHLPLECDFAPTS